MHGRHCAQTAAHLPPTHPCALCDLPHLTLNSIGIFTGHDLTLDLPTAIATAPPPALSPPLSVPSRSIVLSWVDASTQRKFCTQHMAAAAAPPADTPAAEAAAWKLHVQAVCGRGAWDHAVAVVEAVGALLSGNVKAAQAALKGPRPATALLGYQPSANQRQGRVRIATRDHMFDILPLSFAAEALPRAQLLAAGDWVARCLRSKHAPGPAHPSTWGHGTLAGTAATSGADAGSRLRGLGCRA